MGKNIELNSKQGLQQDMLIERALRALLQDQLPSFQVDRDANANLTMTSDLRSTGIMSWFMDRFLVNLTACWSLTSFQKLPKSKCVATIHRLTVQSPMCWTFFDCLANVFWGRGSRKNYLPIHIYVDHHPDDFVASNQTFGCVNPTFVGDCS